jgi:hypothetical protein
VNVDPLLYGVASTVLLMGIVLALHLWGAS